MNIWLKEIDVNDGLEYYELLSVLSSYEDAYARPVLGEFTLEDYEYFKRARVAMASGINLPNNVVRTDTYYVMNNYEPIGYALLRHEVDINKPGGHLGCCLKKEYQNMGIGSVVSELLTKRAYYDLGIENIIYTSKNENIQSQKSLSKIGAKLLKIENGYHFYSLDLTKNMKERVKRNMIDIKFLRENPDIVKENIKKKFQENKLPLVDEVIKLDLQNRNLKQMGDELRKKRNEISSEIGAFMRDKKIEEANNLKVEVVNINNKLVDIEKEETELTDKIKKIMMVIPNIIDSSVPVGKDDSENVEIEKYGEPYVPDYEIPYHADIITSLGGLDKDAAGRTSGNGFYYLMGDIARLSSAMLTYARDFMIDKGFTYCIPPFMIRSDVVTGVMSFEEMDAMMYKIEGEDLYLIGTSEHSMIGKFKDQIIDEKTLPITLTSYSPCFRKEVGAHGIEERGIYRVHQFEKQEMVVLCKPEEAMDWYNKMWSYTVELFRSLDIPVRTLECCSGDLADLKVKSCDVEAWSPRQKKYFEVGSCSTLGDAQARRLGIRTKGENGNYYVSTLNNTVLASTRALIALIENNYNEDGSINIPVALRPYMGGKAVIISKK